MEKEPYVTVYAKAFLEMSPQAEEEKQKLFEWFCQKVKEDGCEITADRPLKSQTSCQ